MSATAMDLQKMTTRGMDSTFMYDAVRDGAVDVIGAYTTDGRISAYDLLVLGDPKAVFPPYDAIILMSPDAQKKPGLIAILSSFANTIDAQLMRAANGRVDLDGQSPEQAAAFLVRKDHGSQTRQMNIPGSLRSLGFGR